MLLFDTHGVDIRPEYTSLSEYLGNRFLHFTYIKNLGGLALWVYSIASVGRCVLVF